MIITILAFAQARSLLGFSTTTVDCESADTARIVILRLAPTAEVSAWRVALDCEYVSWDSPLNDAKELAILPPVSGG